MKTTVSYDIRLKPSELAKTLANASPEEFSDFWYAFYKETHEDIQKLHLFAEIMARKMGSNRKVPLKTLVDLMNYYEIKDSLNTDD